MLASKMIGEAALSMGVPVLMSETHGMAQRGGAVTTVVRVGEDVKSMVSDAGCADVVVAFETTEPSAICPSSRLSQSAPAQAQQSASC